MLEFRLWVENKEREEYLSRLFDQSVERLVGGNRQNLNLGLNQISVTQGTPTKGSRAVFERLSNIFNQIKQVGDPEASKRVEEVQNWLNSISSGNLQSSANQTVGHLLIMLFGEDLYNKKTGKPSTPREEEPEMAPPPQNPPNPVIPNTV